MRITAPPERRGLFLRAMNDLQHTLDQEHQTALELLNQIETVKTAWNQLCANHVLGLGPRVIEQELENARRQLLKKFRQRIYCSLAEGRDVTFAEDFLERALGLDACSKDSVWSRWNASAVVAYRDNALGDLMKVEWHQALRVSADFLGDSLRYHILSKPDRPQQPANHEHELVIQCRLYERDAVDAALLRTPDDLDLRSIQALHTTLRVIEGVHDGSLVVTPITIPFVLNPPCGQVGATQEIYCWHDTNNDGVPAVRIMTGQRVALRFLTAELLQKTKDLLLPFVGL